MAAKLPLSKKFAYASGMLGWSLLISITWVMQAYFYQPPELEVDESKKLFTLIPPVTVLYILPVFSLVLASGRLFDAITDPLIAQWTDRSKNPRGRRIPFLKWSAIPTALFCAAMFFPLSYEASYLNVAWLTFTQFAFFLFMTIYNVPYNALLPELGHTSEEKLNLATWQAFGLLVGMVLSSQCPALAGYIENNFVLDRPIRAYQYAIWIYCAVGAVALAIPGFAIDERKYCVSHPVSLSMKQALRHTLANRNFRLFLVADFSYFTAMSIIYSSMLYFVTVLLGQPIGFGSIMMAVMVFGAMFFFSFMKPITGRFGKKRPIIFSIITLNVLMFACFFLGRYPIDPRVQGILMCAITAIPLAFMSILPSALLAEISDVDSKKTGEQKEGMYFAVRNLFQKFGQTLGMILVISMHTFFGKDPDMDLGIRLTGLVGMVLGIVATVFFTLFNESQLNREIATYIEPTETKQAES